MTWSDTAVRHLLDTVACPRCGADALAEYRCRSCGGDFRGPIGTELWEASQAAATALRNRERVLARVPVAVKSEWMPAAPASGSIAAAPRQAGREPVERRAASAREEPKARKGASATVQSVLAIAGAGLVAVAAIVFTFFNPDLTDRTTRDLVVAAVTVVFLAGARLLGRRGLQFSAEAVGALGMVFLALDMYAFATLPAAQGAGEWMPWALAAVGTLVSGATMLALAVRWRIRVWLFLSLLALAFVPAMASAANPTHLAALIGWLGTGFAAFGLLTILDRLSKSVGGTAPTERVALTLVTLLAVGVVAVRMQGVELAGHAERSLTMAAALAAITLLAALSTRHLVPRVWSTIAGAAGSATLVAAAIAAQPGTTAATFDTATLWLMVITPAAAVAGAALVACLLPLPRTAVRAYVLAGALVATAVAALPPLAHALSLGAATLLVERPEVLLNTPAPFVAGGLATIAAGLAAIRLLGLRRRLPVRWITALAGWFAVASALTVVCLPALAPAGRVALATALAIAAGAALAWLPALRRVSAAARLPLVVGAHLALILAAATSWRTTDLVVAGGIAVVLGIAVVARALPASTRFVYAGLGYAYALLVFAAALSLAGLAPIAVLCLTTSLAALGAIVATYLPRVGARSWWAILAVTAVPFGLGVLQVVVERSGWTALSTGLIFALALALVLTRRPGLGTALRALAAAVLVPSLAVVIVCLGAQLLASSGSPVVLPVIAALVALVLPATGVVEQLLEGRGLGRRDAAASRLAVEASALLTAAFAVALGLAREAAGLGTTFLVLVILGIGALATGVWGGRRYGWWLAGGAFTGALWCAWGIAGVGVIEPYLLPPALAAVVVGGTLVARGRPPRTALALYTTGLALAVVPVLGLLATSGTPAPTAWRAFGLLGAAWLLLAAGGVFRRVLRLRALRVPTLAAAIVAGAAGAVQGVRLGLGLDPTASTVPVVAVCAALAFLGAVPAFAAGRGIHLSAPPGSRLRASRWLLAPAALYLAAGTWAGIERDWFAIWAMWALMLAYLIAVVVITARLRAGRTSLPPVWFIFALAFVTAVVAWSPRDLRVEWFSLPLGLFLLAAGALLLRRDASMPRGTLNSWPVGFRGSWALLGPGLVVLLSASITATFTDPLTWRAILVMAIALLAILVGAARGLAAPFLVGIVVLPIENAFVFAVQIGRGIDAMPWWITLAAVGAVLLIVAVTYERRAAGGFAARLRDLA